MMLSRRVVHYNVHDDTNTQLMRFCQQGIEIFHSAELWIDRVIIGNVITVINHRRLIHWR